MADAILNKPHFKDDAKARQWLENIRWPNGAVCPHCGSISKDHYKLEGEAHRVGLWKCKDCREQFTVTVGTVFERSKVKLNVWLQAMQLIGSSKKGISSKQLERMLGVTYQTAWFMSHRIREAMKAPGGMFSAGGNTIEADETYVGGKEKNKHRSKRDKKHIGGVGKTMVFSLVERGGKVRSATLPSVNAKTLAPYLKQQIGDTANTRLMTDGEGQYRLVAPMFKSHDVVNHGAGEYVRGDAYTNTVEGYFSILKRGIVGTFHHVSPQHLQRYVNEFDFRYNHRETKAKVDGKWVKAGHNDVERTIEIAKGISSNLPKALSLDKVKIYRASIDKLEDAIHDLKKINLHLQKITFDTDENRKWLEYVLAQPVLKDAWRYTPPPSQHKKSKQLIHKDRN